MLVTHDDLSNIGRKILPWLIVFYNKRLNRLRHAVAQEIPSKVGFSHRECRQDWSPTDSPSPGITALVTFHPAPIGFETLRSWNWLHRWNSMSCLEDNSIWFCDQTSTKANEWQSITMRLLHVRTHLTPWILTSLTSRDWNNMKQPNIVNI